MNGTTQEVFPRCKHGIYDPDKKGKPYGCSFCNEHFDDSFLQPRVQVNAEASKFVVGRSLAICDNESLFANKHDPNRCPECNSKIYTIEKEGFRCADCGHVRKAVRRG
jgi:DNA-directed RNA polymerase subunit RPC12/RpoP